MIVFQGLSRTSDVTYLLAVSFLGLLLAGMFTLYPPNVQGTFSWRKPLIGSIFGLICIFGILAVFFPTKCSRVFDFGKRGESNTPYHSNLASHGGSPSLQGHHPPCEHYLGHVFRIGERTFCAACTGLLLGGFLALVGALLYFFGDWGFEQNSSLMVWTGAVGVGLGLFQFGFRRFARLFLNIFFVLGAFLILVGVDNLVQSLLIDLFLEALIIFWLFARISLSQWDHERICYACKVGVCAFVQGKTG